jgi:hypothetical protein
MADTHFSIQDRNSSHSVTPGRCVHWSGYIGAAIFALSLSGCGSATESAGATARGTVTLDGQPLPGGVVLLVPSGGKGQGGSGQIQPDGTFEVRTSAATSGIEPGDYNVFVNPTDDMENGGGIPAKYSDPENPELNTTITTGGANELKFDLTSK